MLRIIFCGHVLVAFLLWYGYLSSYQAEVQGFLQLRSAMLTEPRVSLHNFCSSAGSLPSSQFFKCQRRISTRQISDVCTGLPPVFFHVRRYYYLELACYFRNNFFSVPILRMRFEVLS